MNSTFVEGADGKPRVIRHEHVGLGLAVDVEKSDGSRSLLVPVIKDADTLDFRAFWGTYEEIIRKVRSNKLTRRRLRRRHDHPHQPRHDRHQAVGAPAHAGPGRHRRRGRHRLPGRVARRRPGDAGRPRRLQGHHGHARPTTTASSRAPSRACSSSGSRSCCSGPTGSTTTSSASLGVPYEAIKWRRDVNPLDQRADRCSRSRWPWPRSSGSTGCAVTSSPTSTRCAGKSRTWRPSSTRPPTGSRSGTSTASSSPAASAATTRRSSARSSACSATPTAAPSGIEYMHIQDLDEQHWIQEQVESQSQQDARRRRPALHPRPAQRGRGVREVPRHQVDRPEALRHRGRREPHPHPRRHPRGRGRRGARRRGHGHAPPGPAQRARQHRRQDLRPDVQGVRGHARPHRRPGLGRREVPPRARSASSRAARATSIEVELAANPSHLEAVDPVVEGMVRAQQDQINDARGLLGAADPHARRRRLRRPGRGGRDAQHERHQGLPGRRHHPRGRQQPDRLHHHARGRPVGLLLAPTWPRSSRRRSST